MSKKKTTTSASASSRAGSAPSPSSSSSSSNTPNADLMDRPCYCGDPRTDMTDLICSHNTARCCVTHIDCLKDNQGRIFRDFELGRSCFLCFYCVNSRSFHHPSSLVCTLDSQYGCFYEQPEDYAEMMEQQQQQQRKKKKQANSSNSNSNSNSSSNNHKPNNSNSYNSNNRQEISVDDDFGNGDSKTSSRRTTRLGEREKDQLTVPSSSSSSLLSSSSALQRNDGMSPSPPPFDSGGEEDALDISKKGRRRGIRDRDKKGKGKTVPRCTSPSHFLIEDQNHLSALATSVTPSTTVSSGLPGAATGSSSSAVNPRHLDKVRTDALLSSVAHLYYRPRIPHLNQLDVWVHSDYDRYEYPTLDLLLSPLRKPSTLDDWSPYDIALFESGLCCYGKDFHNISLLMHGRKTCAQCVEFYYVWKKSAHYAQWKEFGRPTRKRHVGKEEQLKIIQEKMAGIPTRVEQTAALSSLSSSSAAVTAGTLPLEKKPVLGARKRERDLSEEENEGDNEGSALSQSSHTLPTSSTNTATAIGAAKPEPMDITISV